MLESIRRFNTREHFYFILMIFFFINIFLWEIHYILTQNLNVIGVRVLSFINAQLFTFIINVRLPHTTHICYSQHSPSSVSLSKMFLSNENFFHQHTSIPPLTLFDTTPLIHHLWGVLSIKLSRSFTRTNNSWYDCWGQFGCSTRGNIFTLWTFFISNTPHTHPKTLK